MINILSIRSSLAFAPYLLEALATFVKDGYVPPRVVRQGANGLSIRADNALIIRHQNSEATFGKAYAKHYLATVRLRANFYDIALKSDEVVMANLGRSLLLSHPQSQMLIEAETIPSLLAAFNQSGETEAGTLPEWLTLSGGDGRLLLSDSRTGRWVLLGSDHFAEFHRRYPLLESAAEFPKALKPPVILVKGLKVHLQSAFKLARVLEEFADTGQFTDYADIAPTYSLVLMHSTEGIKMSDSHLIVAVTPKEARKWAAIIQNELENLQASEIERGGITTIFTDGDKGRWILQMGDEVLVEEDEQLRLLEGHKPQFQSNRLVVGQCKNYFLFLEKASGGCVALTEEELQHLANS